MYCRLQEATVIPKVELDTNNLEGNTCYNILQLIHNILLVIDVEHIDTCIVIFTSKLFTFYIALMANCENLVL